MLKEEPEYRFTSPKLEDISPYYDCFPQWVIILSPCLGACDEMLGMT